MHTTKLHLFFGAVLLSTAVTGCAVRAGGRAYVSGPVVEVSPPVVFVEPPPLVAIEQDVYVVRDYDTPVYFVGDAYWVYEGGVWYRADDWNAGWVTVQVHAVPTVIVHRDHHRYVRYHGPAHAEVRTSVTLRGSATVQSRGRQVRQQPAYERSAPRRDVRKPAAHPGYARERAGPQRRPRYDEPVQRQPVRGRDVVKQPQRQQPRGNERRDDRKPKKGGGRR
jgi:hypothetical protein